MGEGRSRKSLYVFVSPVQELTTLICVRRKVGAYLVCVGGVSFVTLRGVVYGREIKTKRKKREKGDYYNKSILVFYLCVRRKTMV